MVGWTKMPLGMEVGLDPSDVVLTGAFGLTHLPVCHFQLLKDF